MVFRQIENKHMSKNFIQLINKESSKIVIPIYRAFEKLGNLIKKY